MDWYLKVIRQYFDFSGRARRKEYWYFALFNLLIFIGLAIIDNALGSTIYVFGDSSDQSAIIITKQIGALTSLYYLFILIPSFAVAVRRLHDTGRSGWWLLLLLLPLIGPIVLFIFYVLDSQPGTNEYGPNPK